MYTKINSKRDLSRQKETCEYASLREKKPRKETYVRHKRLAYMDRDGYTRKETSKRDLSMQKETCKYGKRRIRTKRDVGKTPMYMDKGVSIHHTLQTATAQCPAHR